MGDRITKFIDSIFRRFGYLHIEKYRVTVIQFSDEDVLILDTVEPTTLEQIDGIAKDLDDALNNMFNKKVRVLVANRHIEISKKRR